MPVKPGCGKARKRLSFRLMSKSDEERARRLAEALRQNLRRRKSQARETRSVDTPGANEAEDKD